MKLRRRLKWLLSKCHFFPVEFFVKCSYWLMTGKSLNLKNPMTFNEKLNWIKIFGHKSGRREKYQGILPCKDVVTRGETATYSIVQLADKLEARQYAAFYCGEDVLVPLLWSGDAPEDIPWETLPDDIVIKCTHGSHCHVIVRNLLALEIGKTVKQLRKWLKKSWYWFGREPSYLGVKPRIIIEPLIGDPNAPPIEYKFMCFHGEPRIMQIHEHFQGKHYIDFFNVSGDWLNWRKVGYDSLYFGDPVSDFPFNREILRELLDVAEKLAKPIETPYVRIDLCYEKDQVLFREVTFFDSAGFVDFRPEEANYTLGNLIKLPSK